MTTALIYLLVMLLVAAVVFLLASLVERLREFAPPHVVDGFSIAHRAVLEQVNRAVQEAYEASRGQAADKGYQLGGR